MKSFNGRMAIPFSKYSGSGNDFILLDNRDSIFPQDPALIAQLCARRTGIGADGLILLENSTLADYRMRIFNSDGGEAAMCGNGMRCMVKFLIELGLERQSYRIETMERVLTAHHSGENVDILMGPPTELQWNIALAACGKEYCAHHLNTGVPHLVLFVEEIDNFEMERLGPQFRSHPLFQPSGCNFNVAEVKENGEIAVRTFERGVEGETLACGTGCTAAALAASKTVRLPSPISVRTRSGETLTIAFELKGDTFENISLCGPAIKLFSGNWVK